MFVLVISEKSLNPVSDFAGTSLILFFETTYCTQKQSSILGTLNIYISFILLTVKQGQFLTMWLTNSCW